MADSRSGQPSTSDGDFQFLMDSQPLKEITERYLETQSDQADSDGDDSSDGND